MTTRELIRIAAPCTVGQLVKLLEAVDAPDTATIRAYNGSFRIEVDAATPNDTAKGDAE